jgi:chorismate mutase/prephenate dehydratase
VHSKDNALGQCRQWLARMLPGVELVDSASTAASVEYAAEHPEAAAIASSIAAELYGVPIVEENVMDKTDNVTRFLVIGKSPTPMLGDGRDKTSLGVSRYTMRRAACSRRLPPSARAESISPRSNRVRVGDVSGTTTFYVDIIGHRDEPLVAEALAELNELCPVLKWLGSYPNAGL